MNDVPEPGVFLIDKPVGLTSFRIVQLVRRALQIKKVGHTGTLDPFATGLLLVCAGRPATKIISQLMAGDKVYEATLKLGVETDTQDLEGKIIRERPVGDFDQEEVSSCLQSFVGEQLQTPPAFSALKYKGKPLYHYARKGIVVEKEARKITINEISCLSFQTPEMIIRVRCSKGTYVRTLAADIGNMLGCGAHLVTLRRLKNGPFEVGDAILGDALLAGEGAKEVLLSHRLTIDEALMKCVAL